MKRRIIILGGGTFEPIRNHLSLSAPAFGSTAIRLNELIPDSELFLTKMADRKSKLMSNTDVSLFIDELLKDESVGTIIMNVALCDYKPKSFDGIECGFHADRLLTSEGDQLISLTPNEKIISKIKKIRPDIFLVGFKTTTDREPEDQYRFGVKMVNTVCDIVLANDTVTRNNIIITSDGEVYKETTNRDTILKSLAELIK